MDRDVTRRHGPAERAFASALDRNRLFSTTAPMSRQTTPLPADSMQQSMGVEEPTQDETQVTESGATEAKPKKAKASDALVREPGKSVLPYSRVQKILKADKVRIVETVSQVVPGELIANM